MKSPAVLYVARYKRPFRLVAVASVVLLVVLRPSVSEMWRENGWFFGIGTVGAYVFVIGGFLESFVRKTWLTDRGIHQRSIFGQVRFVPYSQVQELIIEPDEALLIQCRNGSRLKIYAKESDPDATIEAMR